MKVNESHDIPWYFLGQITLFHSVLSNYKELLAFCDFVPLQMKFFCLLLYLFAFRRHQQIFCHRQMKGDFSNIADTYHAGFERAAMIKKSLFFRLMAEPNPGLNLIKLFTVCPLPYNNKLVCFYS
jgi:hypothetical protein